MADWLVLPDGQRIDMDQAEEVTDTQTRHESRAPAQVHVYMCDGTVLELMEQNAAAVRAWLRTRGVRAR